jgi:hypothetical protein
MCNDGWNHYSDENCHNNRCMFYNVIPMDENDE